MSRHSGRGRPWRRLKAQLHATSTTCWRCGHGEAYTAGHVIPASIAPHLRLDPANLRPEHGIEGCPTCGHRCAQEAGTKSYMPGQHRTARKW